MIFAQQRTLTSITLQNSRRWDHQPASWHDLNTGSQIWDIFHNRQSECAHNTRLWDPTAKCFTDSDHRLVTSMSVVGDLDTLPLSPAPRADHIQIVFNVRILILWHILCLTLPPRCRDSSSWSPDTGEPSNYWPGQNLINYVNIIISK